MNLKWIMDLLRGRDEKQRTQTPEEQLRYARFLQASLPDAAELERQRNRRFQAPIQFHGLLYEPLPAQDLLQSTVESLKEQTYGQWQLHIYTDPLCTPLHFDDARVQVESVLSRTVQRQGFVFFISQGDRLAPNALYEAALAAEEGHEAIYGDEDVLLLDGSRGEPVFKPEYSPITQCSYHMVGRPFFIRGDRFNLEALPLCEEAGGEYAMALEALCRIKSIKHLTKVLYTRYVPPKAPRIEQGRRAVDQALAMEREKGYAAPGIWRGSFRVCRLLKKGPRISILIPAPQDFISLRRLLESIEDQTVYRPYELVLAPAGKDTEELQRFYRELERNEAAVVVRSPNPVNLPSLYNQAACKATGDILVLLDACAQVSSSDWLDELLGQLQRPEVGAVGAKLVYPDGHIAHAGLVAGLCGWYASACQGIAEEPASLAEQRLAQTIRQTTAVSAGCMMIKSAVYFAAGGMDTTFQTAGYDMEFCLRLMRRGYRILYTPFASLVLHRTPQLPMEDAPEEDKTRLLDAIRPLLVTGDPYYSPNYDYRITRPLPAERPAAPLEMNPKWETLMRPL